MSRALITQGLHILSAFRDPAVVLLNVIAVPSRTAALETDPYRKQIDQAERKLNELAEWLRNQSIKARVKVVVARSAAQGIIDEAEIGGYTIIFLMKRRFPKGWRGIFRRSVSSQVVRKADSWVLTAPL